MIPVDPSRSGPADYGPPTLSMEEFKKHFQALVSEMRGMRFDELMDRINKLANEADLVDDNSLDFKNLKSELKELQASMKKEAPKIHELEELFDKLTAILEKFGFLQESDHPRMEELKDLIKEMYDRSEYDAKRFNKRFNGVDYVLDEIRRENPNTTQAIDIVKDVEKNYNDLSAKERRAMLSKALSYIR